MSDTHDPVNHPKHYTSHPSGVEVITITRHMSFNLGNVVKYVLRCDLKGAEIQDLEKAAWYLADEISKRKRAATTLDAPQPDPDGDGWIEWKGGDYPLPNIATEVECKDRSGKIWPVASILRFDWTHTGSPIDIIAYRVVK